MPTHCRIQLQVTCPVHRLGERLDSLSEGKRLFPDIHAAKALGVLRWLLTQLGVESAGSYRTHDLRRGHALDLQLSGVFPFPARDPHSCGAIMRFKVPRYMRSWRQEIGNLPPFSSTLIGQGSSVTWSFKHTLTSPMVLMRMCDHMCGRPSSPDG